MNCFFIGVATKKGGFAGGFFTRTLLINRAEANYFSSMAQVSSNNLLLGKNKKSTMSKAVETKFCLSISKFSVKN